MLNEREWNTINTILLELYMIDDVQVLFQKIMKIIHNFKIFYAIIYRFLLFIKRDSK